MLKAKLDKHHLCQFDTTVEEEFRSSKSSLIVPENEVEHYRDESIKDKEKIEALESEIRAFSSAGFFKRLSYKR